MIGVEADASASQPMMNLGHFLFMSCQTTNRSMAKQSPCNQILLMGFHKKVINFLSVTYKCATLSGEKVFIVFGCHLWRLFESQ